jgi:hypothetical protein
LWKEKRKEVLLTLWTGQSAWFVKEGKEGNIVNRAKHLICERRKERRYFWHCEQGKAPDLWKKKEKMSVWVMWQQFVVTVHFSTFAIENLTPMK